MQTNLNSKKNNTEIIIEFGTRNQDKDINVLGLPLTQNYTLVSAQKLCNIKIKNKTPFRI